MAEVAKLQSRFSRVITEKGAAPLADAGDTTTAIQETVDDVRDAGGGIAQVPDGQFNFNGVVLYPGVTLEGVSQRSSILQMAASDTDAVSAMGTVGWLPPVVQVAVRKLKIVGLGKTSGGTGRGVFVQYGAAGIVLDDLWVVAHPSHAVEFDNTYSATLSDLLLDSNGSDGFHAEDNANNITFLRSAAINNGGCGWKMIGGTTAQFLNVDGEGNADAGFDLRYVFVPQLIGCHMEGNGTNGTSPNVYLHWRVGAGEPLTGGFMRGCLLQGAGVTVDGLVVDGANEFEYGGNWFNNHVTNHAHITANATRTRVWPNSYAGTGTHLNDLSASTQRFDVDPTNLLWRVKPGINFEAVAAPGVNPAGSLFRATTLGGHLRYKADDGIQRSVAIFLENAATLDFPSIAANGGVQELDIAVSGAAVGDEVSLYYPPTLNAGLIPTATVQAAGTVRVRLTNATTGAIDPGSGGYRVKVFKTQL